MAAQKPDVYRLDDILTKLQIPSGVPATDDLVLNLQSVGAIVRGAGRNKLKLYRIVSRVRDICDYIHANYGQGEDIETILENFDRHASMILHAKDALFEVAEILKAEVVDFQPPDGTRSWSGNRDLLCKILKRLSELPFDLLPMEHFEREMHLDDCAWMEILSDHLKAKMDACSNDDERKAVSLIAAKVKDLDDNLRGLGEEEDEDSSVKSPISSAIQVAEMFVSAPLNDTRSLEAAIAQADEILEVMDRIQEEEARHPSSYVMEGHTSVVNSVTFSTDGTRVVSGSGDNTVRIWDIPLGTCVSILEGHVDWVESVAFSYKGTQIASGSGDKTIRMWDTASSACTSVLTGHTQCVTSVKFSPRDTRFFSGSEDGTVQIWDLASGGCTAVLEVKNESFTPAAFSYNRDQFSGSIDNKIQIWDVNSRARTAVLEGHTAKITSVAFSSDGMRIASGSGDRTVRIWDVASGASSVLEGPTEWITSVALSSDGGRVAASSNDTKVWIWSIESKSCIALLEGHTEEVISVAFSPDGAQVVSVSADSTVRLWDVPTSMDTS